MNYNEHIKYKSRYHSGGLYNANGKMVFLFLIVCRNEKKNLAGIQSIQSKYYMGGDELRHDSLTLTFSMTLAL